MTDTSEDTAVVVPVRLPRPLEALRRRETPEAGAGLPAHLTMLYPFMARDALDGSLRRTLADILSPIDAFPFGLTGPRRWPDTIYASVEPEAPFQALQAELAAAFPAFPVYEGAFEYAPHVTLAWGPRADDPVVADDPAWATLPAERIARSVDLIVRIDGRWRRRWRFALRAPAATPPGGAGR